MSNKLLHKVHGLHSCRQMSNKLLHTHRPTNGRAMMTTLAATARPSNRLLLLSILALCLIEVELISVASFAKEVNICCKLAMELGFIQPGPTPIAEGNTGLSRCSNMDTCMCIFAGASCATTSTLVLFASFRPRPATSLRLSEPRWRASILRSSLGHVLSEQL
jgi:hypothetical protein